MTHYTNLKFVKITSLSSILSDILKASPLVRHLTKHTVTHEYAYLGTMHKICLPWPDFFAVRHFAVEKNVSFG